MEEPAKLLLPVAAEELLEVDFLESDEVPSVLVPGRVFFPSAISSPDPKKWGFVDFPFLFLSIFIEVQHVSHTLTLTTFSNSYKQKTKWFRTLIDQFSLPVPTNHFKQRIKCQVQIGRTKNDILKLNPTI